MSDGRVIDLIELHVIGGPWTVVEAEAIGKQAAKLLVDKQRTVLTFAGLRIGKITNAYCSDVRGEDS